MDTVAQGRTRSRGLVTDGQAHTFESTVRSIASRIDIAAGQEDLASRHDFNNREGPVAVGYSPDGDLIFVALRGSNAIDVLDAYSGELVTSLEQVGRGPQGMAFTSDGAKLFVHAWLSRTVRVYDVHNIINHSTYRAKLLAEIPTVANEQMDAQLLAGQRIFYNAADPRMSRDSYLACSSCHLDGAHDGRVWDKTASGEGLRNTISLLGHGGMSQGLVHWSGNFDEIQDFEHDIRNEFGGLGFLSDAQFDEGGRNHPLGAPKAGTERRPGRPGRLRCIAGRNAAQPLPRRRRLPDRRGRGRPRGIPATALRHVSRRARRSRTAHSGQRHDVGTLTTTSGQASGRAAAGPGHADAARSVGHRALSARWFRGDAAQMCSLPGEDGRSHALSGVEGRLRPDDLDNLVAYLLQIDDAEACAAAGPSAPAHRTTPCRGQTYPVRPSRSTSR